MRVDISYIDRESLSIEEVEHNAKHLFGETAKVKALPEANTTSEFIRHAIRLAITTKQMDIFFDDDVEIYEEKVENLKTDFIREVKELLNETIDGNRKAWI